MNPKLNILYALNLELDDEQTRRILLAKNAQIFIRVWMMCQ